MSPIPGAYTFLNSKRIKLFNSKLLKCDIASLNKPGEIQYKKPYLQISTGDGVLCISDIQLEGKKRISINQFLLGYPQIIGDCFG